MSLEQLLNPLYNKYNLVKKTISLRKDYNTLQNKCEQEVENFLQDKQPYFHPKVFGNITNDLKHQYASARFTQEYDANTAKLLGDLKEKKDKIIERLFSLTQDTPIDLQQNAIGRQQGLQHLDVKPEILMQLLFEDIRNRPDVYRR